MTTATILADNGVSSGSSGLKTSGGNDGTLVLQTTTSGGTATTAVTIDTSQNTTLAGYLNAPNTFGFKNRIINGAMMIDQRNAGASVTPTTSGYRLDRWVNSIAQASKMSIQQVSDAPAGFINSVKVTSLSAYTPLSGDYFTVEQIVEGLNWSDMGWGAVGAQTVTLSFWVKSSLTGLFGGALWSQTGTTCYPFSYTINSANTWEQKTVTIAGPTSGTFATTNAGSFSLEFSVGMGSTYLGTAGSWQGTTLRSVTGATNVVQTNGATWQLTGVQLEKGSTATSFDYRPYGTELALCQRYLPVINAATYWVGSTASTTLTTFDFPWQVQPRVAPTGITIPALANFALSNYAGNTGTPTAVSFSNASLNHGRIAVTTTAGSPIIAGGNTCEIQVGGSGYIQFTGCEL